MRSGHIKVTKGTHRLFYMTIARHTTESVRLSVKHFTKLKQLQSFRCVEKDLSNSAGKNVQLGKIPADYQ